MVGEPIPCPMCYVASPNDTCHQMELDMHAWPPLQVIHVASLSREGTHNSIKLKPPCSMDEKPYMACGWTIDGSSTQQPLVVGMDAYNLHTKGHK